jgi:hypothetical protein
MIQNDVLFLLYFVTTPVHDSGSFLAHHQETKTTGPQTVDLKVKEVPLPHYTLGLLMMG